jgi:hypothetical protein
MTAKLLIEPLLGFKMAGSWLLSPEDGDTRRQEWHLVERQRLELEQHIPSSLDATKTVAVNKRVY